MAKIDKLKIAEIPDSEEGEMDKVVITRKEVLFCKVCERTSDELECRECGKHFIEGEEVYCDGDSHVHLSPELCKKSKGKK